MGKVGLLHPGPEAVSQASPDRSFIITVLSFKKRNRQAERWRRARGGEGSGEGEDEDMKHQWDKVCGGARPDPRPILVRLTAATS